MMPLKKNLRAALVYLTLSLVGCFTELPVGDPNGNHDLHRQDKMQRWEDIRRVNPPSQNPIIGTLPRNLAPFKSDYPSSRINHVPYNQRNDGNTKKTSFSSVVPSHFADVKYHTSQANVNSKNNPLGLTGYNSDAKNRYAFQRVQQKPNAESQKITNPASRLTMEEGLGTGMHYPNAYTYRLFSKPKSEMYPDSSQSFAFSLRQNISVQPIIRPVYTEKIFNVNHNNDESVLYDNRNTPSVNGLNERTSRKVISLSDSLIIVRANNKVDAQLSHASSSGTKARKVSDGNMKREGLTKVFAPQLPAPAFTKSHSDRNHSIIPLRKAQLFSFQFGPQDSKRIASAIETPQSSFESKNTKKNVPINAFQRDSLTATQDGYWNGGRRRNPIVRNFQSQWKYDSLAVDVSAITPPVANIAHSYKGFQSVETSGIQSQTSWPKQNIAYNEKAQYSSPKIFSKPEATELKTNIKLPVTSSSQGMSSWHNTGKGNSRTSLGQSTRQSLFVKNYPEPDPMPDNTMSAFGSYKNSNLPSSQNQPYYLASNKPYAFKGFTFSPTMPATPQQTKMHFDQKHHTSSLSNTAQYASARLHTAPSVPKEVKHLVHSQNPLMSNSYKTTHSAKVQLDAVYNGAYGNVFSTGAAGNKQYGTRKIMKSSLGFLSGTKTSMNLGPHNKAVYPQNNQIGRYKALTESQFNGSPLETSQRWTLGGLAPFQNTQALDKTNGGNAFNTRDSAAATGTTIPNPLPGFPNVYRKMGLSQSSGFNNIQFPTSHKSINDKTVNGRNVKNSPMSESVPSIHRSTNKVTGYPLTPNVVQAHNSDVQKNFEAKNGLFNPTKEIKQDRNVGGFTQLNTNESYNAMRLRPTGSVVIGRRIQASQDGKNSNNPNIHAFPTSQSAIYRAASLHGLQANSTAKPVYLPTLYSSVIKPLGKADFLNNKTASISVNSSVGVSQTSRPTSSFVVGKYKTSSAKSNLSASKTKDLHDYKPVRFADIAGTSTFSGMKPSSVDAIKVAFKNLSSSTPGMEESFIDLPFAKETDNFAVDMGNQFGSAFQSTTNVSVFGLLPTAVSTEPQSSFTEVGTAPQTTGYSFEPEPNPGNETTPTADSIIPFDEEILIPNTTMLVTMTSDEFSMYSVTSD